MKAIANIKKEVVNLSETTNKEPRYLKIGYYSMGISSILAGVLLVLNQLNYVIADGIYILWPAMMILLGLETIITKTVASLDKAKRTLRPAWGILVICVMLIACSQVWLMILNSPYIR